MATTVNINIKATNKVTRPVNKAGREIERLGKKAEKAGGDAKKNWGGLGDLFTGLLPRGLQSTIRSFKSTQRQIGRLSQGFKVLKGAIASTGLGLLVVGLGEVVANWEAITDFFRDTSREDALKKEAEALEDQNYYLKQNSRLWKIGVDSKEEMYRIDRHLLEEQIKMVEVQKELAYLEYQQTEDAEEYNRLQRELFALETDLLILEKERQQNADKIVERSERALFKQLDQEYQRHELIKEELFAIGVLRERRAEAEAKQREAEAIMEALRDKGRQNTKEFLEWQTKYEDARFAVIEARNQISNVRKAMEKKIEEVEEREAKARRERARQERIANEKYVADQMLKIRRDLELKEIEDEEERLLRARDFAYEDAKAVLEAKGASNEELKLLHEQYLEDLGLIEDRYIALEEAREAEQELKAKKAIEKESEAKAKLEDELYALTLEGYDAEEYALLQAYDKRVAVAGDDEGLIKQATEQLNKELGELDAKYAQQRIDDARDAVEERIAVMADVTEQGFSILTNIQEAAQAGQDQLNKKQFQRNQALAVAETLVSTYFSAQKAYQSQLTATPDSPIRAALAAAAAVASGLARVAAIKAQKYDGGSSGGSSTAGGRRTGSTVPQQSLAPPQRLASPDAMRAYVVQTDLQGQSAAAMKTRSQTVL